MTTPLEDQPQVVRTYKQCICTAFTFVPEVGSATCQGCGEYTFVSDGKYITTIKDAKFENQEYLAQVCSELTATKIALHDARKEIDALKYHLDGVRKQIRIECDAVDAAADNDWPDNLHLADALEKHLMRPVHHRIEELQKEIDAQRRRAEKAEAALTAVQGLPHPNRRMLLEERDALRDRAEHLALLLGEARQYMLIEECKDDPLLREIELMIGPERDALKEELGQSEASRAFLGSLLTRTANALKGPPADCSLHSTHDLPDAAAALLARAEKAEARLAALTGKESVEAGLRAFLTSTHNRDGILNALAAARDATESNNQQPSGKDKQCV